MSAHPALIDRDDVVCVFGGKRCTHQMIGAGGLDGHHPIPEEFGGAVKQALANACPNHHRRQHSLIRYLYICYQATSAPEWIVLRRFNATERQFATGAITWLLQHNNGTLPAISSWPAPAARATRP